MSPLITDGESPYSVAIFGISTRYLLGIQTKMDTQYLEILESMHLNSLSFIESSEDDSTLLELATFYYLLTKNPQAFHKGVDWMPKLTAKQKQNIFKWPNEYVFSLFELKFKETRVFSKDLIDGKEYLMDYSTTDLDLPFQMSTLRKITILVPAENTYLSAPPIREWTCPVCQTHHD